MKNKRLKKIVVLILLISTMCGAGCAKVDGTAPVIKVKPMEKEESVAYYFDYLGGKDVMPIGGYYGPHMYNLSWNGNYLPNLFTDEIFQTIADYGVNLIEYIDVTEKNNPGAMDLALQLCEKYNIACFSTDGELVRNSNRLATVTIGEKLAKRYQSDAWSGL